MEGRWECAVWKDVVLGVDVDASLTDVTRLGGYL